MIPPNFAPSPDFREAKEATQAIGSALDGAKPEKIVYLSSIGAQQTRGLGLITALHLLEERIDSLSIPSTALRAGWFMEKLHLGRRAGARTGQAVFLSAAVGSGLCARSRRGHRTYRRGDAAAKLERPSTCRSRRSASIHASRHSGSIFERVAQERGSGGGSARYVGQHLCIARDSGGSHQFARGDARRLQLALDRFRCCWHRAH
jgi:hypothetical protein